MYCRFCGNPIIDGCCQKCSGGAASNLFYERLNKGLNSHEQTKSIIPRKIDLGKILSYITIGLNYIWKVIRSIFIILWIIITYTIIGFFMAPLFALFNADFPDLGLSEHLIKIWRKNKPVGHDDQET